MLRCGNCGHSSGVPYGRHGNRYGGYSGSGGCGHCAAMSDTEYDNASDDDDDDDGDSRWYVHESTVPPPPQTDRLRSQPPVHDRAFQAHDRSSATCFQILIIDNIHKQFT